MTTTPTFQPTALTLGRVGRNGVRAQQRAREAQGSARDMLSSRFFFGGTFRSQTLHVFFSSGSGSSCTKGMEMEEEACNNSDCPCELEETEWTEWSDCTIGCGDSGTGTRC